MDPTLKRSLLVLVIISLMLAATRHAGIIPYLLLAFTTLWCIRVDHYSKNKDKTIREKDSIIGKQQANINELQAKVDDYKSRLNTELTEETKKILATVDSKLKDTGIKADYWNQIEKMRPQQEDTEKEKLQKEKENVELMLQLTREKYRRGQMDTESLKKITDEYLKRLIEIESQLTKPKEP